MRMIITRVVSALLAHGFITLYCHMELELGVLKTTCTALPSSPSPQYLRCQDGRERRKKALSHVSVLSPLTKCEARRLLLSSSSCRNSSKKIPNAIPFNGSWRTTEIQPVRVRSTSPTYIRAAHYCHAMTTDQLSPFFFLLLLCHRIVYNFLSLLELKCRCENTSA